MIDVINELKSIIKKSSRYNRYTKARWAGIEKADLLNVNSLISQLENPWISVEDRLPDEFGDYLVYGEGFIESDYWNSTIDGFAFRDDATHWMPLPTPPKETQR